jgi:chromosome segregation ATPase
VSPAVAIMLTREQAQAAVTRATADRDAIQANLLELDGSFGKRLLAGAALTGASQRSWESASAALATLWDTYTAYSAVVDRAAEILAAPGRISPARLEEAGALLTGPSVRLARIALPLVQREITATGDDQLTLAATVSGMRTAFTDVAAVLTAAEAVWNEISDGLRIVGSDLDQAARQVPGLGDTGLVNMLDTAQQNLAGLRDTLNHDPLALWDAGHVDTTRLDRLQRQTAAVTARAGELAAVRDDAERQIAGAAAVVAAARQARQDAAAARERAAAKVAAPDPERLPDIDALAARLEDLDQAKAVGRWSALASELDRIVTEATAAEQSCREAERAAAGLIGRRDELRGLLEAYRAKAAALGAAEDPALDAAYRRAEGLLWTAPADLDAADAAVAGYQRAVLGLRPQGRRA